MIKSMKASQWTVISIFNLLIVAALGLIMRLKIVYELPWVNQRFTLHAHSHFAFSGWITQSLMLCVAIAIIGKKFSEVLPARYNYLLAFNLFCSYGMLVSFLIQGYAGFSIMFSTLTILVSILFYLFCKKNISENDRRSVWWKYLNAAIRFNILSALGTFSLAYTMVVQPQNTELRLASVYFYLHFQYNGWFLLACMGLFHYWLSAKGIHVKESMHISRILIACCIPSYLLSINWMHFPGYLHAVSISVAMIQLGAWLILANGLVNIRKKLQALLPHKAMMLLSLVLLAGTIKFGLQAVSSHPNMATLAFGLRPVVIAYLHLVLLGIISFFLMSWFCIQKALLLTTLSINGVMVFVCGVILNEVFLLIQGISALTGLYIGYMPEMLIIASFLMFSGLAFLIGSRLFNRRLRTNVFSC